MDRLIKICSERIMRAMQFCGSSGTRNNGYRTIGKYELISRIPNYGLFLLYMQCSIRFEFERIQGNRLVKEVVKNIHYKIYFRE